MKYPKVGKIVFNETPSPVAPDLRDAWSRILEIDNAVTILEKDFASAIRRIRAALRGEK